MLRAMSGLPLTGLDEAYSERLVYPLRRALGAESRRS
jgi:hypothetical protein